MSKSNIVDRVYNTLRSNGRKIYKKEIKQYLECYDKQDYTSMWSTDLYINRGGAYCEMMLEVCYMKGEI